MVVDAVAPSLVLPGLAELEALLEALVDRRREPLDPLRGQLGRQGVGRELRPPEDLVGPRAADAGERTLVAEERVQPARVRGEDLPEPDGAEAERIGAEVCQVGLQDVRLVEPDAGLLARARLGEDEGAPVREGKPERGLRGLLPAGPDVAEPSGGHQVHVENELAVVGGEEQVLAAPARAREPTALEGGERRVERLHRRDVRGPGPLDRRRGYRAVERAAESLDLGKLWHEARVAPAAGRTGSSAADGSPKPRSRPSRGPSQHSVATPCAACEELEFPLCDGSLPFL